MSEGWLTLIILLFSHGAFFLAGAGSILWYAHKRGKQSG